MQASVVASIPGVRQAFPLVHVGFMRAYWSVRVPLRSAVASALAAAGPRGRLYCTGHSLGGALASLAAYDLHGLVAENRKALESFRGIEIPKGTSSAAHPSLADPHLPAASARYGTASRPLADATSVLPPIPEWQRAPSYDGGGVGLSIEALDHPPPSYTDSAGLPSVDDDVAEANLLHARPYAAGRRPVPSSLRFSSSVAKPPSAIVAGVEATRAVLAAFVNDPVASTQGVASRFGGAVQTAVRRLAGAADGGGGGPTKGALDEDAQMRVTPLIDARMRATGDAAAGTSNSRAPNAPAADARPEIAVGHASLASPPSRAVTTVEMARSPAASSTRFPASAAAADAGTLSGMLLDDDVLEGADPLDCCGLPPALDSVLNEEESDAAAGVEATPGMALLGGGGERPGAAARQTSAPSVHGGASPGSQLRQSSVPDRPGSARLPPGVPGYGGLTRQSSGVWGGTTGRKALGGGGGARGILSRLLFGSKQSELDVTCYTFGSPRIGNPTFAR